MAVAVAAAACVPSSDGVRFKDAQAFEDAGAVAADTDGGAVLDSTSPIDAGGDGADVATEDVFQPPMPDSDGDGIPDVEDPAPSRANAVLLADPFFEGSGTWLFTSANLAIDAVEGVLRISVLEPFVREGWTGLQPTWTDYYVRSRMRVNAVGSSSDPGTGRAGVLARVNQVTPDRYWFCGLDPEQHAVVLIEHNGGGPAGMELARADSSLNAGEWFAVGMSVRAAAITCRVGGVEVGASSTIFTEGGAGFRSYDVTFEADFIEVYEL